MGMFSKKNCGNILLEARPQISETALIKVL
jgi:hypothetical protein